MTEHSVVDWDSAERPRLRRASVVLTLTAVAMVLSWIVFATIYDVTPRTTEFGSTVCVYGPSDYAHREHVGDVVTRYAAISTMLIALVAMVLTVKLRPRAWSIALGVVIIVGSGLLAIASLLPADFAEKPLMQCPPGYATTDGQHG